MLIFCMSPRYEHLANMYLICFINFIVTLDQNDVLFVTVKVSFSVPSDKENTGLGLQRNFSRTLLQFHLTCQRCLTSNMLSNYLDIVCKDADHYANNKV